MTTNTNSQIDFVHLAGGIYCRECIYYKTAEEAGTRCGVCERVWADTKANGFCDRGLREEDEQ